MTAALVTTTTKKKTAAEDQLIGGLKEAKVGPSNHRPPGV